MNRILIAAVAVLGFAGVAAAQQAPALQGNYSSSVLDQFNGTTTPGSSNIDLSNTASITKSSDAQVQTPSTNFDQNRGR